MGNISSCATNHMITSIDCYLLLLDCDVNICSAYVTGGDKAKYLTNYFNAIDVKETVSTMETANEDQYLRFEMRRIMALCACSNYR
jgi:hypothetical protein